MAKMKANLSAGRGRKGNNSGPTCGTSGFGGSGVPYTGYGNNGPSAPLKPAGSLAEKHKSGTQGEGVQRHPNAR